MLDYVLTFKTKEMHYKSFNIVHYCFVSVLISLLVTYGIQMAGGTFTNSDFWNWCQHDGHVETQLSSQVISTVNTVLVLFS